MFYVFIIPHVRCFFSIELLWSVIWSFTSQLMLGESHRIRDNMNRFGWSQAWNLSYIIDQCHSEVELRSFPRTLQGHTHQSQADRIMYTREYKDASTRHRGMRIDVNLKGRGRPGQSAVYIHSHCRMQLKPRLFYHKPTRVCRLDDSRQSCWSWTWSCQHSSLNPIAKQNSMRIATRERHTAGTVLKLPMI